MPWMAGQLSPDPTPSSTVAGNHTPRRSGDRPAPSSNQSAPDSQNMPPGTTSTRCPNRSAMRPAKGDSTVTDAAMGVMSAPARTTL